MTQTLYRGRRGPLFQPIVEVQRAIGEPWQELPRSIIYHSPDGFEWGFGGSGPGDLALNLLADAAGWEGSYRLDQSRPWPDFGDAPDWLWPLHTEFKFAFLADAPSQGFGISKDNILSWLAEKGVILAESSEQKGR